MVMKSQINHAINLRNLKCVTRVIGVSRVQVGLEIPICTKKFRPKSEDIEFRKF